MNRVSVVARALVVGLVLGGLCRSAQSQAVHEDDRLGFQFKPPKDYKSVAISPREETVVAKYQAKNVEGSGDAGGVNLPDFRAELLSAGKAVREPEG